MLCDEIVSKGFIEPHDPEKDRAFFDKISRAQKFALAPDFAQACDELSNNLDNIAKAFPLCRLPFPLTWIEVAQNDRPNFVNGNVPVLEWQIQPVRVGYLLEATRDDLSAWKIHLLWNTRSGTNTSCPIALLMDMNAEPDTWVPTEDEVRAERSKRSAALGLDKIAPNPAWLTATDETKAMLSGSFKITFSDYGMPSSLLAGLGHDPKLLKDGIKIIVDIARQDWAGELQYIEAVLAMINARNVSDTVTVDRTRYNQKRIKQGHQPLFSHHIVTISARQKRRMAPRNPSEGEHAEVRRHMVRGHWKVRRSGIYFWRPFIRGRRGFVNKEYKVAM